MNGKKIDDDTAAEHSGGAINVLTDDHNRVRGLFRYFAQLEGPGPTKEKLNVAQDICKELVIHAAIEEELFYPAARIALGEDSELINEAEVEHGSARHLIRQLMETNKDDTRFTAKVTVLDEYVKHHMDEEEKKIFPKIKQAHLDLSVLGKALEDRREALRDQLKTAEHIIGFAPIKYFVGKDRIR
jgi:hemerythrin superfamily protein